MSDESRFPFNPGESSTRTVSYALFPESREIHVGGASSSRRCPDIKELTDRLVRQFGLGERPTDRWWFYRQVALSIIEAGPAALKIVEATAAMAQRKDCPDRWFCKVVKAELTRLNMWSEPCQLGFPGLD